MFFKCIILLSIAVLVFAAQIPKPEERIVGGHYIPIEYVPWALFSSWCSDGCSGGVSDSQFVRMNAVISKTIKSCWD